MLTTSLRYLRCPVCVPPNGRLELRTKRAHPLPASPEVSEVTTGALTCAQCGGEFPILAGVAVLVPDVEGYLVAHAKGISRTVPESEIPRAYLKTYRQACRELTVEHQEDDLEAERVNALYLMNHYLAADELQWWKPSGGDGSPLISALVRENWDHGPLQLIAGWVAELARQASGLSAVEMGCGVGGLYRRLKPHIGSYLGVDSSFASIALARHLALGMPYAQSAEGTLAIPEDLLQGPVSRRVRFPKPEPADGTADFVLGDIENPPLQAGHWDLSLALNAIDMLEDPARLPALQREALRSGGHAIQSCPYIWHELVARKLRSRLPKGVRDSARAVEWLYEKAGFRIERRREHQPWLFFKHVRQLEVYSVHAFIGKLGE